MTRRMDDPPGRGNPGTAAAANAAERGATVAGPPVRATRVGSPLTLLLLLGLAAGFHSPGRAIARGPDTLSQRLAVSQGWNLLALPVDVDDPRKSSLFPGAASAAFIYDSAYRAVDTIGCGNGFWLKFPAAETLSIPGRGHFRDSVRVRRGWNLIGGLTTPAAVRTIRTSPAGIVASRYFGYAAGAGYLASDTLRPGAGYMVKASQPGVLVLNAMDSPCPGVDTVRFAGRTYRTVQIGAGCWLRENLDVGELQWVGLDQTDNGVIEKYCWIDDEVNCRKYGGLYQWNEAMQYSSLPGSRGICPPGWHIPTLGEFRSLDTVTGGNSNDLKALRQGDDDGAGTNLTGFSALLSGYRHLDGSFSMLGFQTYFWTSSEQGDGNVPGLYLFYYYGLYYFYNLDKGFGLNIRCMKD